jgi:hypothetical protein
MGDFSIKITENTLFVSKTKHYKYALRLLYGWKYNDINILYRDFVKTQYHSENKCCVKI